MKRAFVLVPLAIVVAVFLLACKSSTSASRDETPRVPVAFHSSPDAGDVLLDGKFIGSTPLDYRLAAGRYKIEIRNRGFANWERELTVEPYSPTRVQARMERLEAK